MSTYSDNLGFVPSTYEEILKRYYELLIQYTGYHQTFDEFLQSDLYLVFQGVARLKFDDDILFAQIIQNFFNWFKESQIKIGDNTSNTYSGLYKALMSISKNVFFINYEYEKTVQAGEVIIVLEEVDKTKIDSVMRDNLGVSLITNPAVTNYKPDQQRHFILDNKQIIHYSYLEAKAPVKFYVKIRYRLLVGAIVPTGEVKIIKEQFEASFNECMKIGTAFEPERYLSTQNIDFVADFKIGYNLTGLSDQFIYSPYQPPLDTRLSIDHTRIECVGDL